MIKLKWRVCPKPTGPYRSFEQRSWPGADFLSGDPAAQIICDDQYEPSRISGADHGPLTIRVAYYNKDKVGFEWKTLKARARTLSEAKELAQKFFTTNPEAQP